VADQKDIDYHYAAIDRAWRLGVGATADYTNALYEGDFSLPLEEAQRRKHEFILQNSKIGPTSRVLDMGCGWGPLLMFFREKGIKSIGVTLSKSQVESCRSQGLEVYLEDCRTLKPERFGLFDAVTCVGAMEHFCTKDDWRHGRQDQVYRNFFETVHYLLPERGRFYLQTGTLGKKMCDPEATDIHADKNSVEYYAALMEMTFPGSWLPSGDDQILRCARPYFKLISQTNGRLDYVETLKQWRKRMLRFGLKKYLNYATLIPRFLTDQDFRNVMSPFSPSANKVCCEREIMDHFRMVFEKI
jgi:cyclopropane-fatty-acyl-phospholipid synthase